MSAPDQLSTAHSLTDFHNSLLQEAVEQLANNKSWAIRDNSESDSMTEISFPPEQMTLIQELCTELAHALKRAQDAEDRAARLQEALAYYADPALYTLQVTEQQTGTYALECALLTEGGKLASAILKSTT